MGLTCTGCHPELLPAERQGENHFGIRFGDPRGPQNHVFLNGLEITNRCREALAAVDGWVDLYDLNANGLKFICPDSTSHAASQVHRGVVEVRIDAVS